MGTYFGRQEPVQDLHYHSSSPKSAAGGLGML